MVFEETLKKKDIKVNKPSNIAKIRIDLEPEREQKLQQIKAVYSNEIKKISRTKLIKMAIDNLMATIDEKDSEEEALDYLRSLYKEAEF